MSTATVIFSRLLKTYRDKASVKRCTIETYLARRFLLVFCWIINAQKHLFCCLTMLQACHKTCIQKEIHQICDCYDPRYPVTAEALGISERAVDKLHTCKKHRPQNAINVSSGMCRINGYLLETLNFTLLRLQSATVHNFMAENIQNIYLILTNRAETKTWL